MALKLRAKPLATAAARLRVTPAHNDNDALLGGRGNDVLGGNNNDTLDGGSGNDALTGVVRIKGDDRIMALLLAESEDRLEVGVGQYCVIELDVIALLEVGGGQGYRHVRVCRRLRAGRHHRAPARGLEQSPERRLLVRLMCRAPLVRGAF